MTIIRVENFIRNELVNYNLQVFLPAADRAAARGADEAVRLLPDLLLRVRVARPAEDRPHLVRPQLPRGDARGRRKGPRRGPRLQEDRGETKEFLVCICIVGIDIES